MSIISDDYINQMIETSREYCICILKMTPKRKEPGAKQVVWEHVRRNFSLRADGVLSIVCPIDDESGISSIYIFDATPDKVRELMDEDPAVKAGIYTYELHPCRSFPGDELPR